MQISDSLVNKSNTILSYQKFTISTWVYRLTVLLIISTKNDKLERESKKGQLTTRYILADKKANFGELI